MSFSKNVESVIGLEYLHKLDHMNFMDVTVEPLPSIKEYGGDEVFHEACRTIEIDHAFRILRKQRKGNK